MDTDSGDATTIAHLFGNDASPDAPASAPQGEQPTPPDVQDYGYQPQVTEPAVQQPVEPQGQEPTEPKPQQPHLVPLPELIETRKRAQAAEEAARQTQRELQELRDLMARQSQPQPQVQPQMPQPIDPIEDPQGFARAIEAKIEHRFLNNALNDSERRARVSHGSEAVDAALQAARQAGMADSFVHRPDAYDDLVKWHKAQTLYSTIGADPEAYKAQLRAQIIAEMKQGTPPPANLPPTLSSATRANATPEVVGSDKDFFKSVMNQKRG